MDLLQWILDILGITHIVWIIRMFGIQNLFVVKK